MRARLAILGVCHAGLHQAAGPDLDAETGNPEPRAMAAALPDETMAAAFLDDLVGAPLPGRDLFVLAEPFRYRTASGRIVTVPAGFETDFASVPRLLRGIVDPTKLESAWAAVIHDYLYREGPETPYLIEATGETRRGFSRADADDTLHEALRLLGIDPFDAWAMWAGVRTGGWSTWRRYRASA